MESVLKLIQRTDCAAVQEDGERQKLLEEIKEVGRLLACNECWFEMECDENLIDSCVYQRVALESRYRYLLKCAKRLGVSCTPFTNK